MTPKLKEFTIEASDRHPEVRLRNGFIHIKGHSIPQDASEFYKPVIEWVKAYVKDLPPHTEVALQIEYYDCDSTKAILDILKALTIFQNTNQGNKISIKWIYSKEDDVIKELGEFFESKLNVSFNYYEEIS